MKLPAPDPEVMAWLSATEKDLDEYLCRKLDETVGDANKLHMLVTMFLAIATETYDQTKGRLLPWIPEELWQASFTAQVHRLRGDHDLARTVVNTAFDAYNQRREGS